jgi:hypothetical protein
MLDRIIRAIKLDPTLYREVADDEKYTNEGVLIVVLVALISSLGVLFASQTSFLSYILQVFNSLLFGWLLWGVVAYFVGSSLFAGRSNIPEMLRTLAYANAPRFLGVLGFIPCLGWIFTVAGWLLGLIAGVIAIRESMEFDTGKAVITAVLGLLVYLIASVVIGIIFAGLLLPVRSIIP